jgi:hypothetical protein
MNEDLVILELNARWGCDIPFGWVPITGNQEIPDTEIFYNEAFHEAFPDEVLRQALQNVFQVTELYEIQEYGRVSVQPLAESYFGYDGLEYIHTNTGFDFVLYFSHESSVTVGGRRLLDEIHRLWSDYAQYFWNEQWWLRFGHE